jgi:hypothetical protein
MGAAFATAQFGQEVKVGLGEKRTEIMEGYFQQRYNLSLNLNTK